MELNVNRVELLSVFAFDTARRVVVEVSEDRRKIDDDHVTNMGLGINILITLPRAVSHENLSISIDSELGMESRTSQPCRSDEIFLLL